MKVQNSMQQPTAPMRETISLFSMSIIAITSSDTHHSHDFVEIEPVNLLGDEIMPIFGDEARARSNCEVLGPGELSLEDNPAYVRGAYANLRHLHARGTLEAAGLPCQPGKTYLLPVRAVPLLALSVDIEMDRFGRICTRDDDLAMSAVLLDAVKAARKSGASYVAIRIR